MSPLSFKPSEAFHGHIDIFLLDQRSLTLRIVASKRIQALRPMKFRISTVPLNVTSQSSNETSRVNVKIRDLASALIISEEEIKEAYTQNELERVVKNALALDTPPPFDVGNAEYLAIRTFWNENQSRCRTLRHPVHIRKSAKNGLPRSLVYIPNGRMKGLYILLKSKSGIKEVGVGKFNRVTQAINFETGELKAFRTAKVHKSHPLEIAANRAYEQIDPKREYFCTGVPVHYRGPWRGRGSDRMVRQDDVEKIGFIMDLVSGGNLYELIYEKPERYADLTQKQKVGMALHLAKAVVKGRESGLVNYDLKPENIGIAKNNLPIIYDFGMVRYLNELIRGYGGTAGYISPEIWKNKSSHRPNTQSEVWQIGVIIAELFKKFQLRDWLFIMQNNERDLDKDEVASNVQLWHYHYWNTAHIDHIIEGCLRYDPNERFTPEMVRDKLQRIYDNAD